MESSTGEHKEQHANDEPEVGGLSNRSWLLAAIAVFCLALVTPFHEVWRDDISVVVPMFPRFEGEVSKSQFFWKWIGESEQRFVAWQVSRNARVLRESPGALFDTEQCHPTPTMMALGEPMIALGVLGIPFQFITGDPLVTYNWVLVCTIFLSALSMFLLVREWTGVPAAGIVAGLLFAFHPDKIADINHLYIHDNLWTVLALLFATRYFSRGYWRDALGLAVCCSMQIAGSYYPFVGAILIAAPLLVWLHSRYGASKLAPGPLLVSLLAIAAVALGVFGPYLDMRSSELLITRSELHFAVPSEFLPSGGRFPGWLALGFVAFAIASMRRDTLRTRPHAALIIAGLLVASMAISLSDAKSPPWVYRLLAGFVPGLDAVRRPNEILSAFHLCFTLLAGLGCAGLLNHVSKPRRLPAALVLVALSYLLIVRPQLLGFESPVVYRAMEVRPDPDDLAFFDTLRQAGNSGPILETPAGQFHIEAQRLLVSGYHERRTSSCVNELDPNRERIVRLIEALPSRDAVDEIAALGFTTILNHHPGSPDEAADALAAAAKKPGSPLTRVHGTAQMTAYEIIAEPASTARTQGP